VRAVEDVKSRTGKGTKEAIAELLKEPKWKNHSPMDAWATYCAKVETDAGKVVALARARTPR
jgi:hypothetical protein